MAPTETSILTNFLVSPAPLPSFITLQKFTDLFPRPQRTNPQVQLLYRDLQHQRAIDTDQVKQNISSEVKKGSKQMREVVRIRRMAEKEELSSEDVMEMDLEIKLFGPTSNLPSHKPHTLQSILPEMEQACADLEGDIEFTEAQISTMLEDLKGTIGDLSDLRYGRFDKPAGSGEVGQEVLDGMKNLQGICNGLDKS
ncbi:MAG: hypothetical protein M1827_005058 [Pycnora praestabilis]|nr:MAG: hypothetical protein M1827_005058 [Pycnora praestabilis]